MILRDESYLCGMTLVSRKEHFNAAHKLVNPNWSDKKNEEVFGVCANRNWHGHNFELTVTVSGEADIETGFVADIKKISDVVRREVIDKVDHKNFNLDVPFMEGVMPSCENIIIKFWEILEGPINSINSNCKLYALRLQETPKNSVEYHGN